MGQPSLKDVFNSLLVPGRLSALTAVPHDPPR
jgi:hypothetical protein